MEERSHIFNDRSVKRRFSYALLHLRFLYIIPTNASVPVIISLTISSFSVQFQLHL
jgi:hypothetical protein